MTPPTEPRDAEKACRGFCSWCLCDIGRFGSRDEMAAAMRKHAEDCSAHPHQTLLAECLRLREENAKQFLELRLREKDLMSGLVDQGAQARLRLASDAENRKLKEENERLREELAAQIAKLDKMKLLAKSIEDDIDYQRWIG